MGTLYKRGNFWWLKFWADGKPYRESSGEKTKRKALKKLKVREGEIAKGNFDGLRAEKTTFEELAEDLIANYQINGYSAIHRVREYVRKLKKSFGGMKATHITADRVLAYILARKTEVNQYKRPPANATINRERSNVSGTEGMSRTRASRSGRSLPPNMADNRALPCKIPRM